MKLKWVSSPGREEVGGVKCGECSGSRRKWRQLFLWMRSVYGAVSDTRLQGFSVAKSGGIVRLPREENVGYGGGKVAQNGVALSGEFGIAG